LRERVPVRDLVTILEALGDVSDQIKDVEALTEHTRRALGPTIARQHADEAGVVRGITVGPRLESALLSLFGPRQMQANAPTLQPTMIAQLLRDLNSLASANSRDG